MDDGCIVTAFVVIDKTMAALGVQRLRARTTPGLPLKLHASLLVATITNAHEQSG